MITLLKASRRALLVILPGFALLFASCAKEEETSTGSTIGTPEIADSGSVDEGEPKTETIADATGAETTGAETSTDAKGADGSTGTEESKGEPKFEIPDTPIPLAGSDEKTEENSAWLTDYEVAKKQATEENKTILMDFTGSDWCGFCIQLHEEVFSLPEFKDYAKENLVLLELDFPRGKRLSPDLVAQNEKLQEEFKVQGFPTILLLDGEGRPFGRTGYQAGGPTAYIEHLSEFIDIRQVRDKAFADAEKAEGLDKAKHLSEGLAVLSDDVILPVYRSVVDEVIALDENDEAGLKSKYTGLIAKVEVAEKLADLQMLLRRSDDEERIFGEFDKLEKEFAETPAAMSQIHLLKIQVLNAFEKTEEVFALADQLAKSETLDDQERSMVYTMHAITQEKAGRPEKGIELLDTGIAELEQVEAVLQLHIVKIQLLAGIGEVDAAKETLKGAKEKAPEELKDRVEAIGNQIISSAPKKNQEEEEKPEGEAKPEAPADEKPAAAEEKSAAEKPAEEKK